MDSTILVVEIVNFFVVMGIIGLMAVILFGIISIMAMHE